MPVAHPLSTSCEDCKHPQMLLQLPPVRTADVEGHSLAVLFSPQEQCRGSGPLPALPRLQAISQFSRWVSLKRRISTSFCILVSPMYKTHVYMWIRVGRESENTWSGDWSGRRNFKLVLLVAYLFPSLGERRKHPRWCTVKDKTDDSSHEPANLESAWGCSCSVATWSLSVSPTGSETCSPVQLQGHLQALKDGTEVITLSPYSPATHTGDPLWAKHCALCTLNRLNLPS